MNSPDMLAEVEEYLSADSDSDEWNPCSVRLLSSASVMSNKAQAEVRKLH
jgi:hypothetical protein